MKLKKIITIILALCTVFAFASCGNNPEELAWEGYDDMYFIDFLEKSIKNASSNEVSISVKDGWDTDELNEDNAEEPYTFIVELTENGEKAETFYFFMDVNDDDLLVAKGALEDDPDYEDEFHDKRDTEDFLDDLAEEL